MRILFLLDSLGAGGAESSLSVTLPHLVADGIEPLVACFSLADTAGVFEGLIGKHAEIIELEGKSRWERCLSTRRLVKQFRPDIVHASLLNACLISRIACLGLPTTLVNSLVNTPYTPLRFENPRTNRFKHRLMQVVDCLTGLLAVDHFHAVNQAVKDEAVQRLRIPASRISVVQRGRPAEHFFEAARSRTELRRGFGFGSEEFVVINVGRQCYQKGQIYLLEAFRDLERQCPSARLLVVGREGDCTEQLERWLEDNPNNQIQFLGHRDDIPELLAAADLFVFPSLFEGIGGAAIEAMAAGLPVLASDIPGLRETLGTQEVFNFFPERDPESIRDGILHMYRHPEVRERQGEENRRRFLDCFQVEPNARRFVEFYRRVAD